MKLAVVTVVLVGCSAPERRPVATPAPAPVAGAVMQPAPPTIAAPAQRFADADPGYAFADPARATKLAAAFPKIDAAMAAEMARQNVGGVAYGVVIDGKLAHSHGLGVSDTATKTVPDADTVYRIGSISKSFTALATLILRDDNALRLDDSLVHWIPEAGGLVYPTRDSPLITVKHLLHHTSGLQRDGDYKRATTEATFLPQLAGLALETSPDQAWSYSNLGFGLLGIVVGHASKSTLPAMLQKRVFAPLGMTSTGFEPPGNLAPSYLPDGKPKALIDTLGVASGAGGIFSSVRDMARYVALQLSAYPPRGEAESGIVKRATLRESHATGVLNRAAVAPRDGKRGEPTVNLAASAYGFGWQHQITCDYDDVIEHTGAIDSHRAAVQMLTWHGVGVIVLSNFGNANTGAFADRIIEQLAATGALTRYARHPKLAPGFSEAMTGLLAVYHHWDEAALAKVLARPPDPIEQSELAGYLQLHGTCSAIKPLEVMTPFAARFAVTCERGTFELAASAAPDGRLLGFVGTSRDVQPPADVVTAAKNSLALLARWDDALFARTFADPKVRELMKTATAALRAEAGTCRSKGFVHEAFDWRFEASCDKGPDRRFDLALDGARIKSILTGPLVMATCPTR
jgi:CubicO group peptidase (beta-lactamase class C family)